MRVEEEEERGGGDRLDPSDRSLGGRLTGRPCGGAGRAAVSCVSLSLWRIQPEWGPEICVSGMSGLQSAWVLLHVCLR